MWLHLSIICHYKNNRFVPPHISARGPSCPWSYGSWIYNYLCNQCLSPLMLWVPMSIRARCTTICDNMCHWLATDRWFSPGPPVSSTKKSYLHDIADILLKETLNTTKQNKNQTICACSKPGLWFSTSHVMGFSILFWLCCWYGLNF